MTLVDSQPKIPYPETQRRKKPDLWPVADITRQAEGNGLRGLIAAAFANRNTKTTPLPLPWNWNAEADRASSLQPASRRHQRSDGSNMTGKYWSWVTGVTEVVGTTGHLFSVNKGKIGVEGAIYITRRVQCTVGVRLTV